MHPNIGVENDLFVVCGQTWIVYYQSTFKKVAVR